ncbi:Chitotriosidase-1 like protein [Argiope bruennichi]|uniref:Chitotriosidase-1 like protein n=1 Tax=Argiope bruennichi TaxID=94029 RepID=A0A8T0EE32_ARGBR|nr:Chitotriosidase-1 like protein [Argiope bruennichi]
MNAFIKLLILLCSTISIFCSTQPKEKPDLLRVCYYTVDNPAPILLNTTLCTHIIAGFSVVTNGVLDLGNDYKKKLYFQTTDLKKNNPELKVLLTVGGGGSNGGFSEALNSTSNRTKFIISTLATLGKYNFDGFDIDWEFPVWNDGIKEDKSNFISFLKEFRALSTFYAHLVGKPPPLLTVAVAAVQNIITSSYDIPGMAKYETIA